VLTPGDDGGSCTARGGEEEGEDSRPGKTVDEEI